MPLGFGGRLLPALLLPIALLCVDSAGFADPTPSPLEVLAYDLAANQDTPELCFLLSQTVARRPQPPLETFVAADPAVDLAATPRKDRMCLTGFAFGAAYTVTLKAGLPGVAGALPRDAQFRIEVPSRPPELSFANEAANVLPRLGAGLPIRSVNVAKIDVEIFLVSDDDLLLDAPAPLTAEAAASFAPSRGTKVWQGTVEPKGEPNKDTVTWLAMDQTVGALKPGRYVATAWPAGVPAAGQTLYTQYFTVSDLGLAAYRGPDSLLVSARSLAMVNAAPGIEIALIARNNRELARVRTDGNGFARFDPAVLQGMDGAAPATVRAYGVAGEFADLRLSDPPPVRHPGVDAALYLGKALFRPGDTVDLLALLRGDAGAQSQKTLRLRIVRPDGALFDAPTVNEDSGGYRYAFTLPDIGSVGRWRIEALPPDSDDAIGAASFDVTAPAQSSGLSVTLAPDVAAIDPAQPATVTVQTQSPDGPMPGVPGELDIKISAADVPFPAFAGFSFRPTGIQAAPLPLGPLRFSTDATGKAGVPVRLPSPPAATGPLEATVVARVFDAAGRPVERSVVVPIATQPLLLGVRPAPTPSFTADQKAHFEIVAVGADGARQEKTGVGWEIVREDGKPSWPWSSGRFTYSPAVRDVHDLGGTVDIPANAPAALDVQLPPGRYRIEVFDPAGEAVSSASFTVGWDVGVSAARSDTVEITPAKPYYQPGDVADVFVKPPYDAEVVIVPADPEIRDAVAQHVPAAGVTMHLAIPRDAGQEIQLMATAVAPPDPAAPGVTRRAFGRATLTADPAPRSLDVKMELPQTVAPQQTLAIPVTATGAGDQAVHLRIVAVAEDADSVPIAEAPQSTASVGAVADNYNDVITPSGLAAGRLPQPGETGSRSVADISPPAVTLYSGIVALDKSGKGSVPLPLPDFVGRLRLKAVAWSVDRQGESEAELAVRYPLSATLQLPAFLSPDDHADLTLALDNVGGPRGEYRVRVHGEGQLTVQDENEAVVNLAEREQRTLSVAVQARAPGDGAVVISVKGPAGIAFDRRLSVPIRSSAPPVSRFAVVTVKPGGALAIDPSLTQGLRPDSICLSLTASAGSDLDLGGFAREVSGAKTRSAGTIVAVAEPSLGAPTVDPPDAPVAPGPLDAAVRALLGYQGADGGFSRWGDSQSDLWLSAYATEFLGRAKAHGAAVPDAAIARALGFLAVETARLGNGESTDPYARPPALSPATLGAIAYGLKTLAANDGIDLARLRYFSDRFQPQIRNPATAGMIAAAFAALGDKATAVAAFARAGTMPADPSAADPLGSDLRDQADLLAAMIESGVVADASIAPVAARLFGAAASRRQFTVAEASWLIRAMAKIPPGPAFKLKVGDKAVEQSAAFAIADAGQTPPTIKNAGDAPVHVALSVTGVPAQGDFKEQSGYEIQRWVFDANGKPIDPGTMKQGDFAVVVLTGRYTGQGEAHPVLVDPLPAGWRAEATKMGDLADRYPWLKDVSGAIQADIENGALVATPKLVGDKREFRLAYVVRAAVRGQFALPGAVIQDSVQPALQARTPAGRTKVDPAS
jgi:uncharacterized protein YfaS (alpha-2-macroglobulin family)